MLMLQLLVAWVIKPYVLLLLLRVAVQENAQQKQSVATTAAAATACLLISPEHRDKAHANPTVGWLSVILTPMGPSLTLTGEGTSRPSLHSSLFLSKAHAAAFDCSSFWQVLHCRSGDSTCMNAPAESLQAWLLVRDPCLVC